MTHERLLWCWSISVISLAPIGCVREPTAAPTDVPANAVVIRPGDSIQAAVDANPPGTAFLIKAGVHRMQSVVAKPGNAFIGERGAVLSGARVLGAFTREGLYWVASGQTQQNHGPVPYGTEVCRSDSAGCIYPEDLFVDNRPLKHVTTLLAVTPGGWFFDYANDKLYLADDPSGHLVEVSVAPDAIRGDGAHGVVVRGLTIEKYANPAQRACVDFRNANAVEIRNNEIRLCHGSGVAITTGASGVIAGNYIHDNGQLGIGSFGSTDLVVESNEVAGNNYAGYQSAWEAGGAKFSHTTGLVVRANRVHDNQGKGIWTDTDDYQSLIERNVITGNTDHGIFREIGYAAVVRDNTVVNNGWYGIIIDSSPDVELYGNVVRDNGWNWPSPLPQVGARDTRSGAQGRYGTWEVRNLWVHDNTIEGTVAAGVTGSATIFESGRQNRFDRNRYRLRSERSFQWRGALMTTLEWQAAGQDINSSFAR